MPSTNSSISENEKPDRTIQREATTSQPTPSTLEAGTGKAEDGGPNTANTPRTRSKLETVILMTTLCSAVFLAALDITIVSTALPTIAQHFNSTSGFTWIGSAFLLAAAVVAPSWGKFSDIWGRKPVLMVAIAIFFIGSALCGAAVNLSMVLAGRVIQGLAAGGLLALVSIVIGDLFSARDRGKYFGFVGMVWAIAFVLGPLIGGAFTSGVSWRWCFYVNLPISGTSFCIIALMLKLDTPKTPLLAGLKVIDWIGSVALVGGMLMLLLGLEFGGTSHPWNSATVICLIVFGVLTLIAFILIERYVAKYPLIPVHLYSNVSNIAIIMVCLFHGITFTLNTYFLPLYCQSVLGATPLFSGVLLLPFAFFASIAMVGSGNYIKKTGRYLDCIRLSFFLLVLGVGLQYDLPNGKTWSKIIIYQSIAGFGIGLGFQPPLIALQSNIPPQDTGAATASFGLVRNVASAIGVVIGSAVFANDMQGQQNLLVSVLGSSSAALFSGNEAQANILHVNDFSNSQQHVIRTAFWASIRNLWIVAVAFAAACLVICVLIKNKKLNKTHVQIKTGLEGEEERRRIVEEQRKAGVRSTPAVDATTASDPAK